MNAMHENITDQAVIKTERLILRPLRKSDAGLIALYAADIRVSGPTRSLPHPLPPGAVDLYIQNASNPDRLEDVWVIDGSQINMPEVMGLIGLKNIDRGQSELGYWLGHTFWNMGFARESVGAVMAQNPHGADVTFAEVFQSNARSAKVLTEAGFKYLGEADAYCVAQKQNLPTWTYMRKMGDSCDKG